MDQTKVPAPRTPVSLDVTYKKNYARCEGKCKIKNISLSGACLEIAGEIVGANEKINVNIEVAGRKRKLNAYVVWFNQTGCGVRFVHGNNRDIQIIDDLIYFVENDRAERRDVVEDIFKHVA